MFLDRLKIIVQSLCFFLHTRFLRDFFQAVFGASLRTQRSLKTLNIFGIREFRTSENRTIVPKIPRRYPSPNKSLLMDVRILTVQLFTTYCRVVSVCMVGGSREWWGEHGPGKYIRHELLTIYTDGVSGELLRAYPGRIKYSGNSFCRVSSVLTSRLPTRFPIYIYIYIVKWKRFCSGKSSHSFEFGKTILRRNTHGRYSSIECTKSLLY